MISNSPSGYADCVESAILAGLTAHEAYDLAEETYHEAILAGFSTQEASDFVHEQSIGKAALLSTIFVKNSGLTSVFLKKQDGGKINITHQRRMKTLWVLRPWLCQLNVNPRIKLQLDLLDEWFQNMESRSVHGRVLCRGRARQRR